MGDFIQEIEIPHRAEHKTVWRRSVERYPETGIDVLIVGAGVGGLTAALECYRKGHNFRIYEREPNISTAGKYHRTFDQPASARTEEPSRKVRQGIGIVNEELWSAENCWVQICRIAKNAT